jgi:hypothetical protein
MPFFATAGSKVYIGGVLDAKSTDFVVGDYSAVTWVEIKGLDTIGSLGDTSQAIVQSIIGEARDKTIKGTRNAGTMELVAAIDYADAGQLAAIAAEKTPYDYAFKVEFNDKPAAGASPKNSTRQFVGKVMSASEAYDSANTVMKLNISVAINSNVVRVAASAT